MDAEQSEPGSEWQRRFEELSARIDALQARADASGARAGDDRGRIDELEVRTHRDRELIVELQADRALEREHVAQLTNALRTSRRIGAAIGIVMATHKVTEEAAFEVLKTASQHTNRRVRALADEVVHTGDVSDLPNPRLTPSPPTR